MDYFRDLKDKTITDEIMYNYTPNDNSQNYNFCSKQLVVESFGHPIYVPTKNNSIKVPKVVKPTNKEMLL